MYLRFYTDTHQKHNEYENEHILLYIRMEWNKTLHCFLLHV